MRLIGNRTWRTVGKKEGTGDGHQQRTAGQLFQDKDFGHAQSHNPFREQGFEAIGFIACQKRENIKKEGKEIFF